MEVSSRQREAGENAGGQFIRNWCEEPGIMVKERLLHSIHIHSRRLSGISLVDVTLTLSRMETPVMPARVSVPQKGSSGSAWRFRNAAGRSAVRRILRECGGVTAIEYGLMTALIAIAIIAAVNTLGQTALTQLFQKVASSL